ncbi:UNVERIFIED_CONTAM: hypothetical protein Sindi_0054000 [Sesamum indicum]
MMRRGHRGQGRYFYSSSWTQKVDDVFIDALAFQVGLGRAQSDRRRTNMMSLTYAATQVKRKVLADRCITWDENTNRMSGSNDILWWEMKEIFCGDDVTASDATTSEDGDDSSHGESGRDSRRLQMQGEIEVIDLATSSEDE